MGSLKKDQQIIAKDVEGLSKAIDSAVAKVKVIVGMNICGYLILAVNTEQSVEK